MVTYIVLVQFRGGEYVEWNNLIMYRVDAHRSEADFRCTIMILGGVR